MKPLSLSKPHVIVMVGIPGSGKSFFAEHFATTFKAPIVSFERLHKEIFGYSAISKDEHKATSQAVNYMLDEVLKTGRTIVYDGQTELRSERALIAKKSRDAGYESLFVWVQTEQNTAKKRAVKCAPEKPSLSIEQFDYKLKQFSAPHVIERAIVISGKHNYSSQLKIVLKHLVESRIQINNQVEPERPPRSRNVMVR